LAKTPGAMLHGIISINPLSVVAAAGAAALACWLPPQGEWHEVNV